jgi:alpha-tubulin suppressor-like RCC1 family protein
LGAKAVQISAGDNHTCALLETGAVRCWGENQFGQLGQANTLTLGDDETPALLPDIVLF